MDATTSDGSGIARRLARLGGALRADGIPTTLRDELDAADVLLLVDAADPHEVRAALRIGLKIPRAAWTAFDRLFAELWLANHDDGDETTPPRPPRHRVEVIAPRPGR